MNWKAFWNGPLGFELVVVVRRPVGTKAPSFIIYIFGVIRGTAYLVLYESICRMTQVQVPTLLKEGYLTTLHTDKRAVDAGLRSLVHQPCCRLATETEPPRNMCATTDAI